MTTIPDITIQPRFSETDALGHINNVAISAWVEFGRTRLLGHLAAASEVAAPESWVVVSVLIEFVAESFFGEDVTLKTTGIHFGNTSMTVECELWQGGRLTVRGKSVLVHRDPETGEKKTIPDALRQACRMLEPRSS